MILGLMIILMIASNAVNGIGFNIADIDNGVDNGVNNDIDIELFDTLRWQVRVFIFIFVLVFVLLLVFVFVVTLKFSIRL